MTASQLARLSPAEREQRALEVLGNWHDALTDAHWRILARRKVRELIPTTFGSDVGIDAAEAAQLLTEAFSRPRLSRLVVREVNTFEAVA